MNGIAVNLKALIKLTEAFGLIPTYNFVSKKFEKRKIYHFLLLVLLGAAYVYIIYTKVNRVGIKENKVHFALVTVTETCNIFINVFTVVAAVTWKFQDFCDFFQAYDNFDQILLNGFKTQIPTIKYFNVHFGIVYLITLTEMALDFFWFNEHNVKVYDFGNVGEYYLAHCLCILTILEYFFLRAIKNRFTVLNKILNKLDSDGAVTYITIKPADDDLCLKINRIVRLHDLVCDLVDYFNDLFGVHVLCVVFIHVMDILSSFDILITDHDFIDILFSVNWMFLGIGQTVMVATMCEKIGKESKKTIAVSFSLLYKYSNNQIVKEKLTILSQQANDRCAQFSAAGFFNIDFSMLFTFVNLITTYIIVIIQFSAN